MIYGYLPVEGAIVGGLLGLVVCCWGPWVVVVDGAMVGLWVVVVDGAMVGAVVVGTFVVL